MIPAMESSIEHFKARTNTLFLVDGLGAAWTAGCLFFILRPFHPYFGMPPHVLTYLAVIGLVLCVYSLACSLWLKGHAAPFLKAIGIGNGLYCAVTMVLLYVHFRHLTMLGLLYFIVEIAIIAGIVYVELQVATALRTDACRDAIDRVSRTDNGPAR
jgi:hypothetical protein